MNRIYLLYNFNNYFNRKLIRYDTLAAYVNAVENDYVVFDNVINFNPADGVNTEHIFNIGAMNINARTPNYMLVCADNNEILQRWFVIESDRTRAGQYKVSLYRDVVAETWNVIKSAPIFVEKAILQESDPAIWNDENIVVNQIKKKQELLKDSFGVAWIVGYLSPDNLPQEQYVTSDINASPLSTKTLYDWQYYKYINDGVVTKLYDTKVAIDATSGSIVLGEGKRIWFSRTAAFGPTSVTTNSGLSCNGHTDLQGAAFAAYCKNNCVETIGLIESEFIDKAAAEQILGLDGQILHDESTGKFYNISINSSIDITGWYMPTPYTNVWNSIYHLAQDANDAENWLIDVKPANAASFFISTNKVVSKIVLTEIQQDAYRFKLSNNRRRLDDQPYSMFAMEYNATNMKVARAISAQLSNGPLYDLQLLPYRPAFYITGLEKDVAPIMRGNTQVGELHWCYRSDFERVIDYSPDIGSLKLDNLCRSYRLCSPNWNGQFEFSASKNGGFDGFKVKCCYKPYQPFIQVMPNFNGLYGRNYTDGRGLICGGKFDLPQTSDAWATYERQNTNYNAVFDRKIENLEVQQKYQKISEVAQAVAGTIQGAGTGAAMGSVGGPVGAAIGGVAGAAASLGAGIADIAIGDKLRQEQLDYTKDMYGLQLQNIQAQPSSLVGVGALTNANTIWPVLETYDCTDVEKQAVKDKLTYNGMTVNRIGTISEFKNNNWLDNTYNYFKGQLIRVDIPDEDWHFVNTVKSELNRGIFIKRSEQ